MALTPPSLPPPPGQRLPGDDIGVTSLAWIAGGAKTRLFASKLDGTIQEADFVGMRCSHSTDCYGGAVWQLAAAPANGDGSSAGQMAAACDDGSIRMFEVDEDLPGATYSRCLTKVADGRLLSLAWHPNGSKLVAAGSTGLIHVLDPLSGRELSRITASSRTNSPVSVWSLLVLPDGTLVSGDSDGATQFWDRQFGTLLHRFTQHSADVLALAASPDGGCVFAAGVDPRIAMFQAVGGAGGGSDQQQQQLQQRQQQAEPASSIWVYTHYKKPHSHDVRCLAVCGGSGGRGSAAGLLASGGVDAQLVLCPVATFLKQHPTLMSAAPQRPLVQLVPAAVEAGGSGSGSRPPLVVSAQLDMLDVWQLAAAASPSGPVAEGVLLDVHAAPRHLLRIKTRGHSHVLAAAMSPAGNLLVYSDVHALHVYEVSLGAELGAEAGGRPTVTRLKLPQQPGAAVTCIAFTHDGAAMVTCDCGGAVTVWDAASREVISSVQYCSAAEAERHNGLTPPITHIALAPSSKLMAVAGCKGIQLFGLQQQSASSSGSAVALVPRGALLATGLDSPVAAIAFGADSGHVAVVTACKQLRLFSVQTCAPTKWCVEQQAVLDEHLQRLPGGVQGLSFKPSHSSQSIIVYSAAGLMHIQTSRPLAAVCAAGSKRQRGSTKPVHQPWEAPGCNGRLVAMEHPCLFVGHCGADSLLVVEKPWKEVLQQLLPPLYKHRYGT